MAHANLGIVMSRLNQPDRAIQHWKDALRLAPDDTSTRSLLAEAYLNKNRYEEAAAE